MPLNPGDRYVAMGSSFAAGPGIRPRARKSPPLALRSARNYAHLLAEQLQLDLVDTTYSGATALDMCQGSERQPRQVDAVTGQTRLVTVTCGGNDVGYVGGLSLGALPNGVRRLRSVQRRTQQTLGRSAGAFEVLPKTLDRLFDEVRTRAPDATLVVVDYLTLLPPEGQSADPVAPDVALWGRETAARLSEQTEAAAQRAGALFVAASLASRDHHAWSADPWTSHRWIQWGSGFPFHPTTKGMQAVAGLVATPL